MTTIAWDGRTLAADRQNTTEGCKAYRGTKLRRTPDGRLIAAAGNASACDAFLDWLTPPAEQRGERASWQEDKDDGVHALEVRRDGTVWRHERFGAFQLETGFAACGSGSDYAVAAMALGRDARAAVELACRFDQSSGGGVDTLTLATPQEDPASQRVGSDRLWFLNGHVTIKLAKAANADGVSITEHLLPGGFGPPFHVHREEDETFYILDGEFRCRRGDAVFHAKPGDVVYMPKGVPHGFRVLSPTGGRCLTTTCGGFEEMLRQGSRPAPATVLPEPMEPTPEMQAHLAAVCAANGIDLLGPPID